MSYFLSLFAFNGQRGDYPLDTEYKEDSRKEWIISIKVLPNDTFDIGFETKGSTGKFYNLLRRILIKEFGLGRIDEKQ